jgi:predicted secreted protein
MKLLIFTLFTLTLTVPAIAAHKQKFDVIGTSPKGQFVAIEEYGYHPGTHMYFVNIRIMNVWRKEYVGSGVQIELPASRPYVLKKARKEAKELALNSLKKYQITP